MVGFLALEMSASPDPECPMMQTSSSKSIEYISDSCPDPQIVFMIDMATDKVYINEINTIPGSLAFYLWEPKGVKYTELLERMIQLALKRHRQGEKISYTFETNILSMGGSFGSKGSKR